MLNGSVNVPGARFSAFDRSLVENGAKISQFLAVEVMFTSCQLSPGLRRRKKDKSKNQEFLKFNKSCNSRKALRFFSLLLSTLSRFLLACIVGTLVKILLLKGGIEPNPGPKAAPDLYIVTQNCRGLTDRAKAVKLIKRIYPANRRMAPTSGKVVRFALRSLKTIFWSYPSSSTVAQWLVRRTHADGVPGSSLVGGILFSLILSAFIYLLKFFLGVESTFHYLFQVHSLFCSHWSSLAVWLKFVLCTILTKWRSLIQNAAFSGRN